MSGYKMLLKRFAPWDTETMKDLMKHGDCFITTENCDGKYLLSGTLSKSYLTKERVGKPSKLITFYALLAEKERNNGSIN